MLGTEWVGPGNGSTVEELLAAIPHFFMTIEHWHKMRPRYQERTSLRLIEDRELKEYDFERIDEALRRMEVA